MASSDPESLCNNCNCKKDGEPCDSCMFFKFKCRGTCPCCSEHRKQVFNEDSSASSSSKGQVPKSACSRCNCKQDGQPCDICTHFQFTCRGTCPCCEKYQKLLTKKSPSGSPSNEPKVPVNKCIYCGCCSNQRCCRICIRGYFRCPGNCRCCSDANFRRKNKVTIDEKYVDKVVSNEAISSAQSKTKKILLIPPEMLNNLIRGNVQQPPQVPQIINSGMPPAILEPISEEKKEEKRMLCSQCFCQGDEIPCRICIVKDSRCHGDCPCCVVKAKGALLESKNLVQAICPRCVCKLGEGSCDLCSKMAGEKKATAVTPTDKNLPSTSGTSRRKRKNASKVAILAKSSVNPAEIRAKQVSQRPPSPGESPSKRMCAIKRPVVGVEYCFHCCCKFGKEPCSFCDKDFNCYGICRCCRIFNKHPMDFNVSEILPEENETFEEIPDVKVKVVTASGNQTYRQQSTSVRHRDHSYYQPKKCAWCNCVQYAKPCYKCSSFKPRCKFLSDETYCSCCKIKLGLCI